VLFHVELLVGLDGVWKAFIPSSYFVQRHSKDSEDYNFLKKNVQTKYM